MGGERHRAHLPYNVPKLGKYLCIDLKLASGLLVKKPLKPVRGFDHLHKT